MLWENLILRCFYCSKVLVFICFKAKMLMFEQYIFGLRICFTRETVVNHKENNKNEFKKS